MELIFETKDEKQDSFEIELLNNSLVNKWLSCFKSDLKHIDSSEHVVPFGGLFIKKKEIEKKIVKLCGELHSQGLKLFPPDFSDFTAEGLIELHRQKEMVYRIFVEEKFKGAKPFKRPIGEQIAELNNLIHQAESVLEEGSQNHRICFLPPVGKTARVEKGEAEYFSTDHLFGYVYLDYFTNGRSPVDSFRFKSPYPPQVQQLLGSRFWLSFQDDFVFPQRAELDTWLKENDFFGGDPQNYPLGEAPIGKIKGFSDRKALLKKAQNFKKLKSIRF